MLSTSAFFQAMIPLYIMALVGFIGRRTKVLNKHANYIMTQLLLYITLPALILYSLGTNISLDMLSHLIWLLLMSIFILSLSIIVGLWLRRMSKLTLKQKSVYESLIIFGNQGFIGFAISYIVMGEQGIVYLTLFNIFYLILIWTYGIYIFTKNDQIVNWRKLFFNPGILATLIGLLTVFVRFNWPTVLMETFESVGKMTIPLSMILTGSLLANIKWNELRYYSKNVYIWIAASCKLLIIPLFLFVFLFLHVPYPLIIIAVLTSAMPSATTISVYAQKFGGDVSFASFGVALTTLLCIFTIPLLYILLQLLYPIFYL